MTRGNPVGGI